MDWERYIDEEVHRHYWEHDDTCAFTTLSIVSALFAVPLESQVMDAALGMWGAGGYRAQCGLVEGALMSIGILGSRRGLKRDRISALCNDFAQKFEKQFGSLICSELRPEGFAPDNPPHICEDLSRRAIHFTTRFIADMFQLEPKAPAAGA
jgi:C_GCAxxG_C_C family probable redox protein